MASTLNLHQLADILAVESQRLKEEEELEYPLLQTFRTVRSDLLRLDCWIKDGKGKTWIKSELLEIAEIWNASKVLQALITELRFNMDSKDWADTSFSSVQDMLRWVDSLDDGVTVFASAHSLNVKTLD